jgi:hypothetical protein
MIDFFTWLEGSAFSTWVREAPTIWAFSTILTLHTFGMGVLVGASSLLDLRLLGIGRTMPLGPLESLYRIMWAGFWLNLVTGSMLFAADATSRGTQWLFFVKMVFVVTGVATMVLIRRNVYGTASARAAEPIVVNGTARSLAALSLVAWALAITAGRLLAYVN